MLKTLLIFAAIFSICKTSIALPIQREFPLLENAAYYAQLCEQCNALSLKPCIDFDLTDAELPHFNMSLYCREWKQLMPSCNIAILKRTKSDGESLCLLSEGDNDRARRSASNEDVEETTVSAVEEPAKSEEVAKPDTQEPTAKEEPAMGVATAEEQPNGKVRQAPEDEGEAEEEGAAEVTELKETDDEVPAEAEASEAEKPPEAEQPSEAEAEVADEAEGETPEVPADGMDEAAEPPPPAPEEAPIESPATADAEGGAESQPENPEEAAEKPPTAEVTETAEVPAKSAHDATQNEVSAAETPAVVDYQADEASPPKEAAPPAEGEAKVNEVPATNDVASVAAKAFACYSCTGGKDDVMCRMKPTKTVNCPKGAEGKERNGCFTLLKADTNTTERGCLAELTAEGQQFCRKQMKQCHLCYENGCNQLPAPSTASTNDIGVAWQLTLLLAIAHALIINHF